MAGGQITLNKDENPDERIEELMQRALEHLAVGPEVKGKPLV